MSSRHNAYLDAARELILDVGWKRTTLTSVARRAGVSRMTIYRTWPDMETLLADLMTREWADTMAAIHTQDYDEPTPAAIADGTVAAIAALRANPLLRRILDLDPEILLPYLLDRRGRSQAGILSLLTPLIAAGQAQGHIKTGDPEVLARTIVLAAHGLTISAQTMTEPEGIDEDQLTSSFAEIIAKGLSP